MNSALANNYKSRSQMARIVTEHWAASTLYCAACSSANLTPSTNNTQAIDFICPQCAASYQLKSRSKNSDDKIVDAGYEAMMTAVQSDTAPHLLLLHYTKTWQVQNLMLIPKFFFTDSAIEKRKPLGPNARRAGWVGCNILLTAIASEGKLPLIQDGAVISPLDVRTSYQKVMPLANMNVSLRGWALDVFACISRLQKRSFTLTEIYQFEEHLASIHPENRNIRPKIRQQLQVLRDANILKFVALGKYHLTL